MLVYKYMDFCKFEDLVKTQSLLFVNPLTKWEDKNEGFIYRIAKTEEGRNLVREVIKEKNPNKKIADEMIKLFDDGGIKFCNNLDRTKLDWFNLRCQSWCLRNENDEKQKDRDEYMWKNYCVGDGVRIVVDNSKFDTLFYFEDRVRGFKIEYIAEPKNNDDMKKEIGKIVDKGGATYYPRIFKYKYNSFEVEQEFRFYVQGFACKEYAKVLIDTGIVNFIDGIWIKPNSEKSSIDKVRELCREYGLLEKLNFNLEKN